MQTELTAKQVIKNLREGFKALSYEERRKLFDILSALRGPDEHGRFLAKFATTSIVRTAVFGDLVAPYAIVTLEDKQREADVRSSIENSHFSFHQHAAFDALGLEWRGVNGVIPLYGE